MTQLTADTCETCIVYIGLKKEHRLHFPSLKLDLKNIFEFSCTQNIFHISFLYSYLKKIRFIKYDISEDFIWWSWHFYFCSTFFICLLFIVLLFTLHRMWAAAAAAWRLAFSIFKNLESKKGPSFNLFKDERSLNLGYKKYIIKNINIFSFITNLSWFSKCCRERVTLYCEALFLWGYY